MPIFDTPLKKFRFAIADFGQTSKNFWRGYLKKCEKYIFQKTVSNYGHLTFQNFLRANFFSPTKFEDHWDDNIFTIYVYRRDALDGWKLAAFAFPTSTDTPLRSLPASGRFSTIFRISGFLTKFFKFSGDF